MATAHIRKYSVLLGLILLTGLLPTAKTKADHVSDRRVVVVGTNGIGQAEHAVRAHDGEVIGRIGLIGAVVAEVPGREAEALAGDARVASVTNDYTLKVQGVDYDEGLASSYPRSVGAPELWSRGVTGRGVGVALLDTGIADHPDLAGRVIASADLTGEGTFSDSYGHGTFLGGLIAGNGAASGGRHVGIAPESNLVSIKVAGADGTTTLGQVLYGLQLIDASKEKYGTRVVLMALSGPAHDGPDPLVLAVERMWADGLVVVVAAGNTGPTAGSVGSPGVDPYVITVGGTDDQGTAATGDDTVASWSSRGPSVYGMQKPEVVAPGSSLVSLRAPGSTIDASYSGGRIDENYFRGSGTSMAAAVAAGGAALLLQERPHLTPDEVKGLLLGSAAPLAEQDPNAAGDGTLDLERASLTAAVAANQDLPLLPGGATLAPADPTKDKKHSFDWYSSPTGGDRWLGKAWAGKAWAGKAWVGKAWAGKAWANSDWSGKAWADSDWAGKAWAGKAWAGKAWAGKAWASDAWSGGVWTADAWSAVQWR